MIVECRFCPNNLPNVTNPDWQDVRQIIHSDDRHCMVLALDYQPTLLSLCFVIRVAHQTIITNGIGARIAGNTSGSIYIGDRKIQSSVLPQSRNIVDLETWLYESAASEFGADWLTAMVKRSRSQIVERERRLSVLRAHLRYTQKINQSQREPIAAITAYLQHQGTGTWN